MHAGRYLCSSYTWLCSPQACNNNYYDTTMQVLNKIKLRLEFRHAERGVYIVYILKYEENMTSV